VRWQQRRCAGRGPAHVSSPLGLGRSQWRLRDCTPLSLPAWLKLRLAAGG
jgi:hypothetical protein